MYPVQCTPYKVPRTMYPVQGTAVYSVRYIAYIYWVTIHRVYHMCSVYDIVYDIRCIVNVYLITVRSLHCSLVGVLAI